MPRIWMFLLALAFIQLVSAYSEKYEILEPDVGEAKFLNSLSNVGKKGWKGAKGAVKKYGPKFVKKIIKTAKNLLKKAWEKIKGLLKTQVAFQCYGTTCVACVEAVLHLFGKRGFGLCAGTNYNSYVGRLRFAVKYYGIKHRDYNYIYKKTIDGLMTLPNCLTIALVGEICVQGFEADIKLEGNAKEQKFTGHFRTMLLLTDWSIGLDMEVNYYNKTFKPKAKLVFAQLSDDDNQIKLPQLTNGEATEDSFNFENAEYLGDIVKKGA